MAFAEAFQYGPIYAFPLWLVGLVLALLLLGAEETGYRVGLQNRRRSDDIDADSGGGAIVLTSLFAVLGLLLAFTYSAAVERHESRRQAIVQEANALGTAYARADVIAEPLRSELKKALYDYAVTRLPTLGDTNTKESRTRAFKVSVDAQQLIWPLTRRAVTAEERGPVAFGLLASINEVMDQHIIRLDALTNKLPAPVMYLLLLIAVAALAITGFNAGTQGRMGRWRLSGFALLLAGLLLMILDFDRPGEGSIQLQRASLEATVADMRADLAL